MRCFKLDRRSSQESSKDSDPDKYEPGQRRTYYWLVVFFFIGTLSSSLVAVSAAGLLRIPRVRAVGIHIGPVQDGSPSSGASAPASNATATPTSTAISSCQQGWNVVQSPDGNRGTNSLQGITQLTANDMWAVGYTYRQPTIITLVEHWNGSSWQVVPSPNVGTISNYLYAVAAAADDVWAVGSYSGPKYGLLIEHWDGISWNVVPGPSQNLSSPVLNGVVAISSSNIWAVGTYLSGHVSQTLVTHWDGSTWQVVSSPNPGSYYNVLYAIAAVSPTDMWAVGYQGNGSSSPSYALAIHWDGSTWSSVSTPSGALQDELHGITAISSNDVWAVGYTFSVTRQRYEALMLHWDGSTWQSLPGSNVPGQSNYLYAVAAQSSEQVWAVGMAGNQTLIETWDGIDWYIEPSPNPGVAYDALNAVAATAGSVWAAGVYNQNNDETHTLVEKYLNPCPTPTGSPSSTPPPGVTYTPVATPTQDCTLVWRDTPVRDPGGTRSTLRDVDVLSANNIWLVGDADARHLIEHWNGIRWTVEQLPIGPSYGLLNAVAVISADDVWAVGYINDAVGDLLTLAVHWDGQVWSQSKTPNVTPNDNRLTDLAALSADSVWAVGHAASGKPYGQTLILHWDGTQWSIVSSPNVSSATNLLLSVTALTESDIWAVGTVYFGANWDTSQTLVEHWNGTQWSLVGSPNPGDLYNQLDSVTASVGGDVWAVGFYWGTSVYATLVLRWDGNAWQVVPSPNAPGRRTLLDDVSIISSSDIWSVGYSYAAPDSYETFTQHWNGEAWRVVDSPNPGSANFLFGVQAVGANDIWAVGSSGDGNTSRPYVLRYSSPCNVTVTPTVTSISMPTVTGTSTPCSISFTDAPPESEFYTFVRCLACRGIVSGYDDGTFRPGNNITRGQIAKMVSNASNINDDPGPQMFEDVDPANSFYLWINRLSNRGYMGGYPCGGEGEPCNPPFSRPYFRPFANATRGQLSKIVSNTAELEGTPTGQFYADVTERHPFYQWIMRLTDLGVMSGYQCGRPAEPCDDQQRPYFRPYNNVTRGQAGKIVANTFFPNCQIR